jgi:hypothetical protein
MFKPINTLKCDPKIYSLTNSFMHKKTMHKDTIWKVANEFIYKYNWENNKKTIHGRLQNVQGSKYLP